MGELVGFRSVYLAQDTDTDTFTNCCWRRDRQPNDGRYNVTGRNFSRGIPTARSIRSTSSNM